MNSKEFFAAAKNLSDDPTTRIPEAVKPLIDDQSVPINCHCHVFNDKTVPKALFNRRVNYSRHFIVKLIKILHQVNKRSNDDPLSNYAYFLDLLKQDTKTITDKLLSYYPGKVVLTPLMMDMHNRAEKEAIGSAMTYIKAQLTDLSDLISKGYPLMPFIPIDPKFTDSAAKTHYDVYNLFLDAFNGKFGFMPGGIKIYPSLGYLPSHPKLMDIFKVCEEKRIPVTTHCNSGIVRAYNQRMKDIEGWMIDKNGKWTNKIKPVRLKSGKRYRDFFLHPKNWEIVLEHYPKLKLNFGHFGGSGEWTRLQEGYNNTWVSRIIDYFLRFENVYADLSYSNAYPQLFEMYRNYMTRSAVVGSRVLYGFDYYMVVTKGHYRSLKADFDTAMGDDVIKKIACENPRRFLFK